MDNEKIITVPYIVHEGEMARAERQLKRLWIALIVTITLLAVTNLVWIWYESQFETISYEQDSDGINNINTGSQGDVEMYEPKGENQSEKVGKSTGSKNP